MVIKRMSRSIRLISFFVLLKLLFFNNFTYASNEETFDVWLQSYKKYALSKGISKERKRTPDPSVADELRVRKRTKKVPLCVLREG